MKNFLKRQWKVFLSFWIGPVLGTGFAYWYFQFWLKAGEDTPSPDIGIGLAISLAFMFMGSLLNLQITESEHHHEIKDKIDKTKDEFLRKQKEQLRSRVKIIELTGSEIDQHIMTKISGASTVRNTYVNIAEKRLYAQRSEDNAIKRYHDFLSHDDRRWIDITTIQDMNLGLYKNIKPNNIGAGTIHEVSIINTQTDIINFLLIDKNCIPTDVYFGWVGEGDRDFRVFWTSDKAMLGAFDSYFKSLSCAAVEKIEIDNNSNSSAAYKSKSEMLIGRWVCIPQPEDVDNDEKCHIFSILNISVENGAWRVCAEIYDRSNLIRFRVVESEVAMFHGSSIFFEGTSRNLTGENKIITFGQFKLPLDFDDTLIGTYVAEDERTVRRLFAQRVGEDVQATDKQAIDSAIGKIMDKPELVRADEWVFSPA